MLVNEKSVDKMPVIVVTVYKMSFAEMIVDKMCRWNNFRQGIIIQNNGWQDVIWWNDSKNVIW